MIGSYCHSRRPRRGPITDLIRSLGGGLRHARGDTNAQPPLEGSAFLRVLAHNCASDYDGGVWATYDTAYRRQAANCNNWNWGHVDAPLFSETFAERARVILQYRFCSGDTHGSLDCPYAPDDGRPPGPYAIRVGAAQSHVLLPWHLALWALMKYATCLIRLVAPGADSAFASTNMCALTARAPTRPRSVSGRRTACALRPQAA